MCIQVYLYPDTLHASACKGWLYYVGPTTRCDPGTGDRYMSVLTFSPLAGVAVGSAHVAANETVSPLILRPLPHAITFLRG